MPSFGDKVQARFSGTSFIGRKQKLWEDCLSTASSLYEHLAGVPDVQHPGGFEREIIALLSNVKGALETPGSYGCETAARDCDALRKAALEATARCPGAFDPDDAAFPLGVYSKFWSAVQAACGTAKR